MKARPIVLTTRRSDRNERWRIYASPEDLYVYENGRHYVYAEEISFSDWTGMNENMEWTQRFAGDEFPPIISNIGLRSTIRFSRWRRYHGLSLRDHELWVNTSSGDSEHTVIESVNLLKPSMNS